MKIRYFAAAAIAASVVACGSETASETTTTTVTQESAPVATATTATTATIATTEGAAMDTFAMPSKLETTASGLQYSVDQPGTGAQPTKGQTVAVHYTGWLTDGTKFDSSRDRGTPIEFPIGTGRVIAGWDEGVVAMKVGEKRTLVIPAALGYGATGAGGVIPPNATLVFKVELIAVK